MKERILEVLVYSFEHWAELEFTDEEGNISILRTDYKLKVLAGLLALIERVQEMPCLVR